MVQKYDTLIVVVVDVDIKMNKQHFDERTTRNFQKKIFKRLIP